MTDQSKQIATLKSKERHYARQLAVVRNQLAQIEQSTTEEEDPKEREPKRRKAKEQE